MTPDPDIAAFAEANADAIAAAREFARRAQKGIPADRWSRGTAGDQEVARGIVAQAIMFEMVAKAFNAIWQEKAESMQLHSKDSKYFEAGQ